MEEELGFRIESIDNPWIVGGVTAISYILASFVPLIPYALLSPSDAFGWSLFTSVAVLFGLGAGKTFLTRTDPLKSGFEFLVIGLISAGVGYGIGRLAGML